MIRSFDKDPAVQAQLEKLGVWRDAAANGTRWSWLEIEKATAIRMDLRGKGLVRRVLRHRQYLPIHGQGIEFADATSANAVLDSRASRVRSAVKRAHTTGEELIEQFLPKMGAEEQRKILQRTAMFAALRLSVKSAPAPKILKS
jgi:hypothetical protein